MSNPVFFDILICIISLHVNDKHVLYLCITTLIILLTLYRKQVKVKGQFKNLVKGAKKGATTGVKRKMRQARRKKNKN